MIEFFAVGDPAAQGSKAAYMRGGRPVLVEQSKAVKPWRAIVTAAALAARGDAPMFVRTPLELACAFVFCRPGAHYGTGRNADTLKASAPVAPMGRPDVDKLLRAIGDALTNVVYDDDARLARVRGWKLYADRGEPPGALVRVRPVSAIDVQCARDWVRVACTRGVE